MKNKKYLIPDEIALLYTKARAAKTIRNLAVKVPFGYKKAMIAAVQAIQFTQEFVNEIYKLYPELNNENLSYSPNDKEVMLKGE